MRNYFIYRYEDNVSSTTSMRIAVIFIHQAIIKSPNSLSEEINIFFQENSITDRLVVIIPGYLDIDSHDLFSEDKRESTFARVPGRSQEFLDKCLIVYQFNEEGELDRKFGVKPKNEQQFKDHMLRCGTTVIFKNNGGLVESTPDHHFVFPSNKHCSKFIRTGNVLVHQSEIFFIAIQLLRHFKNRNVVFCDTSSINVLPYAVFEVLRRFNIPFEGPTVNSFESYEIFESHNDSFPNDSLILISSSTSGNIIDRILKERRAEKSQIIVIYFLGPNRKYLLRRDNIICNLTKDDSFPFGEPEFDTFESLVKCELCAENSRPIYIRSDVFLTVQPKVQAQLFTTRPEFVPKYINLFVQNYRSKLKENRVIKVYHKDDDGNADYEIYFDFVHLIKNIGEYTKFSKALNRYIDKYIPANTKYILYLPDEGSKMLADFIVSKIPSNLDPILVRLEKDFVDKITATSGTVVIVASCITTGKKLLQISRLLRNRQELNLIYFVGIYRPTSEIFSHDLISDLRKGKDKSDERLFVAVETIYCSIQQIRTSWEVEKEYLEQRIFWKIDEQVDTELYDFINKRLHVLLENKRGPGLLNDVFLNKFNNQKLRLRKNFAFWNFEYHEDDVAQSEVYFTISAIVGNLENRDINSQPSLKQTHYVRNILSPRNFHRFNDGIIQASILRSGKPEYFSYDLDPESNLKMKEFLLTIIDKYDTEDGEALLEFILAIGVKKLKLKKEDTFEVLEKAVKCPNKIISGLSKLILDQVLHPSL